jgi:lysophospholipase L1-like esterase
MKNIEISDPLLNWIGAISLEKEDGWIKPWRIPSEERLLFGKTAIDDMMLCRAGMPAGVRIAFRSDTTEISGALDSIIPNEFNVPETDVAKIDLVCDGALRSTFDLHTGTEFGFDDLPGGEKAIELWLPEYREIRLRSLRLSSGASLKRLEDKRRVWLVYGSSYTQSRGAASPFYTWPAVAARVANVNHLNLAFGGQCHLDSMVARMLRDMPADIIAFEAGVNIQGRSTLDERALRAALIGFVKILRERHKRIPIAVMSALYAWERETTKNNVGLTLADTREIVREAIEALQGTGDHCLHYYNGLDFIGESEKHLVPDHVHPSAEGYKVLGQRFGERVIKSLLDAEKQRKSL